MDFDDWAGKDLDDSDNYEEQGFAWENEVKEIINEKYVHSAKVNYKNKGNKFLAIIEQTTLENNELVLDCSVEKGIMVQSIPVISTPLENECLKSFEGRFFESFEQLLTQISPKYHKAFEDSLNFGFS